MTLLEGATDCKTYGINLPRARRIILMGQMLQAMYYLHRRGVLHRDLKPDNVFVTRDEQVKVMDFGLAKLDKGQSTQSDTISGTVSYMAPEQFQGGGASVASDLHAVGVMVYEIMVRQHPFKGKTIGEWIMNIMTHTPDFSAISDNFVPWLQTILEKDPAKSFTTTYDAMIEFYNAVGVELPPEDQTIRESFLQANTFVGRDSELKQLTAALDTLDTQNAFFLIGGESGVGKSRLLDEFRIQALVKGATVLRGQAVEGGGLPFQLWREIVRHMLLLVEVTDLQASILKDIVSDMDALLGREIALAPELTGKAYQDRIILNIVDLFRKLTRPVVLLLEDLQWTSESLAVLQQMLKVTEQLPNLMLVADYRDDEAPKLPDALTGMTPIKLARLDETAVQILIASILGERGARPELVQMVQQQSEGNTFFIIETVRALAEERGSLEKISTANLPPAVLTSSMQELMQRRLSKVDARYTEVQKLASVIGREIDTKLLAHIHDATTVEAWLNNASEYGVVTIQGNRWRFAHNKLRETVIANIPHDTLPQMHRTAAETIEAVYPENDGYNETLLDHWQHVGDIDKELHYLNPVVQNLIDITSDYDQAQMLLKRGLAQLSDDDERRVTLLNWLSRLYWRQGNYEQSQKCAVLAQELAHQVNDQKGLAASLKNLGSVAMYQGEYAHAADMHQQSLEISQALGDQIGIASSLNSLGTVTVYQGEYAHAIDLYQQSLALYQQAGKQRDVAGILNNLGVITMRQGDYGRATDLFEQSLTLVQQMGSQRGVADQLTNLGAIAYFQQEYGRAADLFEQGRVLYQKLGVPRGVADTSGNLGELAYHQKDYAHAIDLFEQSLALYQELGEQRGIARCLHGLGSVAMRQGEYGRAIDLMKQSLALRQQLSDQIGMCNCFMALGWVAFKQEDRQAASWFTQALRTTHKVQRTPETLWAVVGFSGVLIQAGKAECAAHYAGLAQHQHHPDQNHEVHTALPEIISLLEAALSPEELQVALERGKSLDLDTVVAELLAEFGDDEQDDSRQNRSDT